MAESVGSLGCRVAAVHQRRIAVRVAHELTVSHGIIVASMSHLALLWVGALPFYVVLLLKAVGAPLRALLQGIEAPA